MTDWALRRNYCIESIDSHSPLALASCPHPPNSVYLRILPRPQCVLAFRELFTTHKNIPNSSSCGFQPIGNVTFPPFLASLVPSQCFGGQGWCCWKEPGHYQPTIFLLTLMKVSIHRSRKVVSQVLRGGGRGRTGSRGSGGFPGR